jgi:succinate dehydrogenase hydrophobic anchor subunit
MHASCDETADGEANPEIEGWSADTSTAQVTLQWALSDFTASKIIFLAVLFISFLFLSLSVREHKKVVFYSQPTHALCIFSTVLLVQT